MKLKRKIVSALLCAALLAPSGVLAGESKTASGEVFGPAPQTSTETAGPQKNKTSASSGTNSSENQAADEASEAATGAADSSTVFGPSAEKSAQSGNVVGPSAENSAQSGSASAGSSAENSAQSGNDSAQTDTEDSLEGKITEMDDTVTVAKDSDVLDYPGRKDGNVIGEVLEQDELSRTGTIDGIWSQILFQDDDGKEQTGYIPSSVLKGYETDASAADTSVSSDGVSAGSIHEGSGDGVFSEAIDGVTSVNGSGTAAVGVVTGTPVSASADASLVDLGIFQITHYCPCSICCGPYANGITATGVTAVTNHTIAVDPTVIPYGSKIVINGQVYVAEDCGGAIKGNRIDIYVGSHAEGEAKGTFNTEVYLLQEG